MTCTRHDYDESGTCFNCGRPQNLVDAIQRWCNRMDSYETNLLNMMTLVNEARDLLEHCLDDLDPAKEKQ